jgi:hypothetical protein
VPMTRSDIRPGVVVVVPKDADRTRPGMTYQLEVRAAYDACEPGWVRVGGHVRTRTGKPSPRRHSYRDADLWLASISMLAAVGKGS